MTNSDPAPKPRRPRRMIVWLIAAPAQACAARVPKVE
jgi:hypothetical protein